jgi:hypothetical protein
MNNPPAFPCQFLGINKGALSYEDTYNQEGMTLRDYFAAKGMAALIVSSAIVPIGFGKKSDTDFARAAYEIADAMLAVREKQ